VGVRPFLALAALLAIAPLPAFADEIDDCEKLAAADIARDAGSPKKFEIDRRAIYFDKAETTVGKEFVSSVLHGPAKLGGAGEGETDRVRFICLHGGTGKGALFFWLLPD
jgi:hypothetical protein